MRSATSRTLRTRIQSVRKRGCTLPKARGSRPSQEAIRAYQQALQLKPNDADIHNKLGDAYYYLGRLREAIDSYTEAARIQPDNAETFYNLAIAYSDSGNPSMAAANARILQKLDGKLYEKYLRETM